MSTTIDSLQTVLAGEHAAIYVLSVLGGRTSEPRQPALWTAIDSAYHHHRARRDYLIAAITDLGVTPVPAEPAYDVGAPSTGLQLSSAAATVESRCAALYADLISATAGPLREWAIVALTDAATREVGLGRPPEHFPGAAELAGR